MYFEGTVLRYIPYLIFPTVFRNQTSRFKPYHLKCRIAQPTLHQGLCSAGIYVYEERLETLCLVLHELDTLLMNCLNE